MRLTQVFQFHKGTIKTSELIRFCQNLKNFNSIKVRLKHPTVAKLMQIAKFQFHKGTIKTFVGAVTPHVTFISIP